MVIKINYKLAGIFLAVAIVAGVALHFVGFAYTNSRGAVQTNTSEQGVELPILMYHHILEKSKLLGKFTITPGEFEKDLQFIQQNGYTTISVNELIAYSEGTGSLPEKPIMITFDDGYLSFYQYAYPLLQKYNMKAVLSIIGVHSQKFSETDDAGINYAHVTWDEVKEMSDSGLVEIENHTYNMHTNDKGRKGCRIKAGESDDEYKAMFKEDVGKLQDKLQEILGEPPTTFTFPFGYLCSQADEIVKEMGFKVTLSCQEKLNYIESGQPDQLYRLNRYNRPHDRSTEEFFKYVLKKSQHTGKNALGPAA